VPFVDRVAYKHSLKEVPFDVPEQVCITKDNKQLAVDGLIYYQVTDPRIVDAAEAMAAFSPIQRALLPRFGISRVLQLTEVPAA
jgi:regulator of protease activity HflC (stomatin/prohibitin superfamily)